MQSKGLDSPRRPHFISGMLLGCISAAALGGCHDVLFPKDAPRTQFEAYDRMRNQEAPVEEYDLFGRPQPALRERLSQK